MGFTRMQKNELSRVAFSVSEVSEVTSLGRSSIYQEIQAGRLATFKVGSRTLIHADDLNRWINEHRCASAVTEMEAA